jgi:hypothetical protein
VLSCTGSSMEKMNNFHEMPWLVDKSSLVQQLSPAFQADRV